MGKMLTVTTMFLIQMIITFETSGLYAMAPILSNNFGINHSSIILVNIGFALAGICAPFFGVASEKYGKKKFIIIGVSTFLIGSIITSYANGATLFLVGRSIIGLGYYNLSGLLLAYLGDIVAYSNRGKIYGIIRAASGIGILLSPLTSTYLISNFSLKVYYLIIAFITAIILLLSFFIPKVEKRSSYKISTVDIILIFRNRDGRLFLFLNFSMGTFLVLYFSYIAVHLEAFFNLSALNIGKVLTYSAFGTLSGIFIAGILSDRIGKLKLTKIYYLILIASIFLINIVNIHFIWIITFIMSLSFDGGWTIIQTISSEIIPEERGVFMSLVFFVVSLSLILFYIIGPVVYSYGGFLYTTVLSGFFIIISYILFLKFAKNNTEKFN
ncbi:MFS transporter [Alkalibaculum sp. M08DMB]|uniref:MFS transporter n=1 Tax=Alkalibaculum sporogenes TaxID=2655001 RepID=A0A6A7K5G6_9FIRM|nr:MFS transporter [Alkalibaculum sporogenes]MPW24622.1 MFS transporter [Alkalibaculum sporogenes]